MGLKQAIVIRSDLQMGKGKIAAQVSHASLSAYKKTEREEPDAAKEWEEEGKTTMIVAENTKIIGAIAVADAVRETSHKTIRELKRIKIETIMLTGDNQQTFRLVIVGNIFPPLSGFG